MQRKKLTALFIILFIISPSFFLFHKKSIWFASKEIKNIPEDRDSTLKSQIFNWDSIITRVVGDTPKSIALGDVDNDGELDIVVANYLSGTLTLLLWNIPQGSWNEHSKSVGNGPCAVALGDANNDGFCDIVVANNLSKKLTILLWNDTEGDWNSSNQGVGNNPCSVAIGDANNDGLNEIVSANFEDNTSSIFTWNISRGTWDPERTEPVGNGPIDVEIGDVNNDGLEEIITANQKGNDISILTWDEANQIWNTAISQPVGNKPSAVTVGDGNNDGYLDIVTANQDDNSITMLAWNVTTENWDESTSDVGNQPASVVVGDVNSDGQEDIVTADYGDARISILLWNINNANWDATTQNVGNGPTSVAVGDANNDGLINLATANSLGNNISILLWNATVGTLTPSFRYRLKVGNNPSKLVVGDVNNDGERDIVVANFDDENVSVFCWNESINTWTSELTLDVGHCPSGISIGDANNDGAQDIVTSSSDVLSKNVSIILWNKTQKNWDPFITQQISMGDAIDVVVADANNDGANDIIASSIKWAELGVILWNKSQKNWDPYFNILAPGEFDDIEVVDINNDGFNDLIGAGWYYPEGRYIKCYLWNSTLGWWDNWKDIIKTTETPLFTTPFTIGDATNDGKKDLVTVHKVQNKISIYSWNTTLQWWNPPITKPIWKGPTSVEVGDINNDGFNDIVTSNNGTATELYGRVTILLWNASKQDWETPKKYYTLGEFPKSVIIQDVTDDNMNDIIVINHQNEEISIIPFNRYPFILSRTKLQTDSSWVKNEDFGNFSIDLTEYEADLGEISQNLKWYTKGLDSSLVNVTGEYSTDDVLTFNSIPNISGNDTFELCLQDRYGDFFSDKMLITLIINPVNDVPVILNKENIQNNSIWVQSKDTDSFQINLTAYEFDVEDIKSALIWFVIGLDEKIAMVEGENSTNDILTFSPKNVGTDNFSLILMDSGGAYDSLTITIKITPSLTRILGIIISSVALGIAAILIERYRIKRRDTRTRRLKPSKKELKRRKITQNSTSEP